MYTTQAEMINRFGEKELIQLTDRDGSAGAIVAAVLNQAIADADAEINSHLGSKYQHLLPLNPVPPIITRIASDMARWHLYEDSAPEDIRSRYKDAVKLLENIAAGKATLGLDDAPEGQGAGDVEIEAPTPVFSRDDLKDF